MDVSGPGEGVTASLGGRKRSRFDSASCVVVALTADGAAARDSKEVGGPILTDKVHYFGAFERTQQDTLQVVDTEGLFPNEDGIFTTPYRETLITAKVTSQMTPNQYLAVRYGRNTNSQPYGADPLVPVSGWGNSENKFNSINVNHNFVLGGSRLNEFIFQYADFANAISANSLVPQISFPNGV